ncbi:Ferredoxin-NADP reductase (FNR) nucleotide-binding domain [Arabidopsis suecica]|uniref:Ferredoxin-NADP reductase (FNR) nucleotide-binding domain n=1 Tax=Arabidopsis suecica TaxID=45249 RepID=A0A8T1YL96_ARASU|nr:Ferredoxin-NADP reductase (FNR) nucleotide-binding domain [Arabidopsis suecica]
MENASTVRFSSCRGVAFEIKPHANPFAVDTTDQNRYANAEREETSSRFRLPWDFMRNASKVFPSSIQHSMSRASSHFCDLDSDNEDEEEEKDDIFYLEEGGIKEGNEEHSETDEKAILASSASKHSEKPQQPPVPKKRASRLSIILLDQGLFTVYKRLFVLSLFLNVLALVLAATGNFAYARNRAALFSIANILALTLCRSEAFLRIVFYLTVNLLGHSFVPLRIKIMVTSLLQSLGGIHSGCGVSSIAWLIYALVLTLKNRDNTSTAIIAVASTILSLLCLTSAAAFPLVRHLHHNVFERVHRFAGWTALGLVWAFIVLTISYDPKSRSYTDNLGSKLIKTQEFWFTLTITVSILLPWLTVRRVPVDVSSLSGHASLIKFRGGVKSGILGRISPSPLSEWHAFGIISDGKTSHMMLAGAVGDFTKSLVSKPPTHLWVRTVHFAGLPYLVNLYDKVLLVATGSGICVFLSFLMQQSKAEVYLIWVAKGLDDNFGSEIVNRIKDYPHQDRIIVHDTAVLGRPNVSEMSVEASKKFGAQVVIVTSNPEGSRDVVNACKASGVPAFGPIWDS